MWIYYDEHSKQWQVRIWNAQEREAQVVRAYKHRSTAWVHAAFGITPETRIG